MMSSVLTLLNFVASRVRGLPLSTSAWLAVGASSIAVAAAMVAEPVVVTSSRRRLVATLAASGLSSSVECTSANSMS